MDPNESMIDTLEATIPKLAEAAFHRAYKDALESGFSVYVARDGKVVEVFPDGSTRDVKSIDPPFRIDRELNRRMK
jgi:hypothetical protein